MAINASLGAEGFCQVRKGIILGPISEIFKKRKVHKKQKSQDIQKKEDFIRNTRAKLIKNKENCEDRK